MNEQLLHYIWRFQLINKPLKTIENESISIIKTGDYNHNAGPDFLNAKVKIGDLIFAGNIEIHIQNSDFEKHKHQHDSAYQNLILHVVFDYDKPITQKIPTIELNGNIPLHVLRNYEHLLKSNHNIACSKVISAVPEIMWEQIYTRMAIQRLERKVADIQAILISNQNNWEETFYQMLAKGFGMKVNAEAFMEMAKATPLSVLAKQKNSLIQLEALMLGQSGLLNDIFSDTYILQLQKEYQFLQHKFSLDPISKNYWKLSRMRPQNFPSLRIAQFAALVHNSSHLLSKIIDCVTINDLKKLFQVAPSDYWQSHFQPDKSSRKTKKSIGNSTIELFIINTIVPMLFVYGKYKNDEVLQEKALGWLTDLPYEKNKIINVWRSYNIKPINAFQSQALIELRNEMCDKKNCLNCLIGQFLIKQ